MAIHMAAAIIMGTDFMTETAEEIVMGLAGTARAAANVR